MITPARLKECLDYYPLTGSFTWIKSTAYCIKPGMPADSPTCNGYIGIKLDGKNYLAHRLAWLYMFGEFPPGHLDHINCVRTDNRIANLRPATHTQNMHNQNLRKTNKSGHKGVSWCNKTKKWHSQCMFERKKYHLGKFENIEDAIQAVESFRNARHGEFANHGQTASKE